VARLALRSGAPVVPVGLIGNRDVTADRTAMARPADRHPLRSPADFSGRESDERSSRSLREVTEQIRTAVQALSGSNMWRLRTDLQVRGLATSQCFLDRQ